MLISGDAVADATTCFERALAIARAQEARLFELKAAVSLGRVWVRQGRSCEAAALVGPVLSTFEHRLDFPDLRDARMLLDLAKSA